MSLLALDLGEKRVGVAISKSGIIAEPYKTINFDENFYSELKDICSQEKVKKIIVGLPKSLSGKENKQEKKTKKLAKLISKKIGLEVEFVDERYTSKIAQSRFESQKTPLREGKIDEESAVIILETYLEQKKERDG